MDRADGLGTGVAIVGHVALFGALSIGLAASFPPKPAPPPAMEVEFVDTVALEAVAAPSTDAMTQAKAPDVGTPEEAMTQPAPVPEPLPTPPPPPKQATTPVSTPQPPRAKPVEKAAPKPQEETKPTIAETGKQAASAKPAVAKAAPAKAAKLTPSKIKEPALGKTRVGQRPTRTDAPAKPRQLATAADKPTRNKPAPAKPQRARATTATASNSSTVSAKVASSTRASAVVPAKPAAEAGPPAVRAAIAQEKVARASRLGRELLIGLTDEPEAKPAASAAPTMNPEAMAGIQAAIKRQVQPCADRQVNPGPGANRISVKLNLKLNKDGSLASTPQVVSTTGIDDENSRYERRVADLAVAAFTGCAPLAGLPDELYRTSKGGWSNFIMNYRLARMKITAPRSLSSLLLIITAAPALAQTTSPSASASPAAAAEDAPLEVDIVGGISQPLAIAVPVMPTPQAIATAEGDTASLGRQVAEIVAADLRSSGLFTPAGPGGLPSVSFAQVTAPAFATWRPMSAQALVQGFVRAESNGNLTVGCYLYDVSAGTELTRAGFTVAPANWRRAAHKCADAVYGRLTGEGAYFDTRLVYVAESGPKTKRVKRIAVMDADGSNHRYLTSGQSTVLTPRFSPLGGQLVYMTYADKRPRVFVLDLATRAQRPIVAATNMTFAPRYSPDGRSILFSMAVAGNTDIYRVPAEGGAPVRLTFAPGIDTGGSYSPDGTRIVFESDRGGAQQLYIMGADGSNQRRISFGGGSYATPVWSPRGDWIAFTRIGGGRFRIGIMNPSGQGEKLLTESWQDEGPSWAPNGRVILFHRTAQGSGKADLWSVDLTGVNERRISTPADGSDPSWSPLIR